MKCPKCGYMRQVRDDAFVPSTECPSCGIVYAKHDTIAAPAGPALSAAAPHLRKSAVDPESLKKARNRVEKRLRERMESRTRDDQYEQTLKLAKKITEENINNGKDAIARRFQEKTDDTPATRADEAGEQAEQAVLLDEVVGVRLHDDNNLKPPKDGDGASATAPSFDNASTGTAVDADTADAGTPAAVAEDAEATPSEADAMDAVVSAAVDVTAEAQPASREDTPPEESDYPHDVKVETFVLPSQVEAKGVLPSPDDGPEPTAARADTEDEGVDLPEAHIAETSNETRFGANLTRLIPIAALLILVAGLVGAVLSWTTIGDVEAGVSPPVETQQGSPLPLGLLLGFAYLATSALGFAFFWVSSKINHQLKDIRQILMVHPDG